MKKQSLSREEKNRVEKGTLYLVATPIGNLSDLSERAVKVLSDVDFIAAEDTRNTLGLLTHLGISKPLVSYFEHNKKERGPEILARLAAGESCALVTDAGTPGISDPGEDLVRLCAEAGIPASSIPGPVAAINALILSALPTGKFVFEGFLPVQKAERRKRLAALADEARTMLLYEAPHKLRTTLSDLCKTFGEDRKIALCRELTKLNEEVRRTTLGDAVAYYNETEPRGEYVLVLEGKEQGEAERSWDTTPREQVERYMSEGLSKMDAVKRVAKERGLPKNDVYKEMIEE